MIPFTTSSTHPLLLAAIAPLVLTLAINICCEPLLVHHESVCDSAVALRTAAQTLASAVPSTVNGRYRPSTPGRISTLVYAATSAVRKVARRRGETDRLPPRSDATTPQISVVLPEETQSGRSTNIRPQLVSTHRIDHGVSTAQARQRARDEVGLWADICFGLALNGNAGLKLRRHRHVDYEHLARDVDDLDPLLDLAADVLVHGGDVHGFPAVLRRGLEIDQEMRCARAINADRIKEWQSCLVVDVSGNQEAAARLKAAGASLVAGHGESYAYLAFMEPRRITSMLSIGRALRRQLGLRMLPRVDVSVSLPGAPGWRGLHFTHVGRELTADDVLDLRGGVRLDGSS